MEIIIDSIEEEMKDPITQEIMNDHVDIHLIENP